LLINKEKISKIFAKIDIEREFKDVKNILVLLKNNTKLDIKHILPNEEQNMPSIGDYNSGAETSPNIG